jgi:3-deoxy-7-phosphoheptulonate synthase
MWCDTLCTHALNHVGTDGGITVAMDAIKAASNGHHFLSVTKQGLSAIVQTDGNDACHVILRGGKSGPNYDTEDVKKTADALEKNKLSSHIMIDCSHGNSSKDHKRQPIVAQSIVSLPPHVTTSDSSMHIHTILLIVG